MSVRESNKLRTRRALADSAVSLFSEHGYDSITMADVAAAAGVSRRTAFRYFPAKDELLLDYSKRWMDVFDESVETNKALPVGERLRVASHAIADHIEQDPEPLRRAFALVSTHPAIAAKYAAGNQAWIDRVAAEISGGLETTPEVVVRSRVLASAFMGMIDSVCMLWADGDQAMGPLLDHGCDILAPSFRRSATS
ncbi:MAG TPA: TetR/AcrR family transcriptional regulator [Actinobacteria bacterium]|nr:HTH-type transcriptional repressor KstR [bacterium BMS3Bbin02]HDL41876.1 TetR/AcrR family transcriptional regulator [Actinomycetota bacterium]